MAGGLACWSASVRGTRMRWTVLRRYTAGNGKPPSIPRPARTEIGGNHTDHNHGVVMAGAVDLDVIAVVSKNTDDVVRVKSKGFDGRDEVKLEQLSPVPAEQGRSAALIRGVAAGIANRAVYWAASTPIPRPMCCAAQGCPVRLRSRLSLVLYSMGNTTKAVSPR